MKVWEEMYGQEIYGQDADGNRGVMITMYELEYTEEEYEDIAMILLGEGYTYEDTGVVEIFYNGIYLDINIEEYKDTMMKLGGDDVK